MTKVYLAGAGPGDPELITLKARRVLEFADCILYDHLANPELLRYASPDAERIYVGKKKSDHAVTQDEICALLIDRGRRGLNVVRLKGGDPFIFGRGGEEAEALAGAGIPFEIVPGVTAPLGIAAYTGVPLTHRDHTSVVTFITGHDVANIDWGKVGASETLVVYMGLSQFEEIALQVMAAGRNPDTPAMAVRWGTRPDQEVVSGTLATLPALIHQYGMKPPATIIIGEVVTLRDKLSWFEKLPLFGRRIVVTRARQQAGAFSSALRQLGAEVVELPTIEIQPPSDEAPLDRAIAELESYQWLVFTSANGVNYFLRRLAKSAKDPRAIRGRIAAIGPATAEAFAAAQIKVDVTAQEYIAEGLLTALAPYDLNGSRILLARAAVARDLLPLELEKRGANVDVVETYRTMPPPDLAARARLILASRPHWIAFTSSSTVENLIAAAGPDVIGSVSTASIGPITSASLRKYGIPVTVEAAVFTVPGLVDAISAAGIIGQ